MSSPSVTATVSANDLASPKFRELIATIERAKRVAHDAFSGEAMSGRYVRSIDNATLAAQRHVGALHQIHSAHKAIAATVAGYAGLRMMHGGVEAIKHALPYLREDRAIQARTGYSDADMAALRKQQRELAATFGSTVEATQKAHETFGRLKYDAATNVAITGPTAIGARAMGVTAEQNSELMESMLSQFGVHFDSPADAKRKAMHLNDLAAVATKKSNMKFEDVLDYTRYSAAAASAVNVSPEQSLAMGMALRRGGIVGSEAGVFARQFYARMMAPTRKGREIAAQYGINLDDYASHGTISGQGLSDKLSRSFGKGLSKTAIAAFDKAIDEHGEDLLSDRGKFAEAVVKARRTDGDKLSETDRKHLVKSANEYFDWTKTGIRGGPLLDAFMAANSPMLMQGFLGDKQGARGTALLAERDKYYEAKADQAKADGFAQHVSDDMNKGLAAATDRLAASFDALQNTVVQANEGWLTSAANAASGLITSFNGLDPKIQEAAGIFAGLASVTAAGGLVYSFASLVLSARRAAAALDVLAAGGIAAPGGAAGKAGKAASAMGALGFVSRTAGWAGTAYTAYEYLWPEIKAEAAGTDSAGGGGAANYRRRLAALNSQKVWGDMPPPGRFDKYSPIMLDDVSSRYLRNGGAEGIASNGWRDSVILGTGAPASRGFGDPGKTQVEGTVNGAAELHVNINGEMRPTPYLEGIIHRAENVANMSLHGQLGTSMQGPGDNSLKASQSALTAAP